MMYSMFDAVRMADGKTAHIVEIFDEGAYYLVDVDLPQEDGSMDWDTIGAKPEDIIELIHRAE